MVDISYSIKYCLTSHWTQCGSLTNQLQTTYLLGSGNFVLASHAEIISTRNWGVTTCFSETKAHI